MDTQLLPIAFIVLASITMAQNLNPYPVLIPKVATTYLGGTVTFTCTKADISMETTWQTELLTVPFAPSNNNISVTLTSGVHKIEYNNTSVRCITKYPDQHDQVYQSNESKILIQGPLSSIEPNVTQKDPCTVEVYWKPPFTLKGVPILGYNINITNINTTKHLSTSTNSTSIQIPLGYDYNISIAAVNGAGIGNKSIVFINSTDFNENYNISQVDVSREGNKWNVEAQISNDILCENKSNQETIFKACNQDGLCYNTSNVSVHTSNNQSIISAIMPLLQNQFYNLTIAFNYDNFTVVTGYIHISTYDLQRIINRKDQNGKVCLKLEYAKGSVATGCHIKLFCDSEEPMEFNIEGFNKKFHKFWCSPPFGDKSRVCLLNGYDKVGNFIEYKSGPAVKLPDIIVFGVISSIDSSVITLRPTETPTSRGIPSIPLETPTSMGIPSDTPTSMGILSIPSDTPTSMGIPSISSDTPTSRSILLVTILVPVMVIVFCLIFIFACCIKKKFCGQENNAKKLTTKVDTKYSEEKTNEGWTNEATGDTKV